MIITIAAFVMSLAAAHTMPQLAVASDRARELGATLAAQDSITATEIDADASELLALASAVDAALRAAQRDVVARDMPSLVRDLLRAEAAITETEGAGLTMTAQREQMDTLLERAQGTLAKRVER